MRKLSVLSLTLLIFYACKESTVVQENTTVYFNGDIITMEGEEPDYVEALMTKEDTIVYVGPLQEAKEQFKNAKEVDLQGKTLVPGFVDGHIHFSSLGAQALGANLLADPDGEVNTIDDLVTTLKTWAENNDPEMFDGWIVGVGYDDAIFGEHPTKEDLDKVSTEYPVLAIHISGHISVMNSLGLEKMGYTAETHDPDGGKIRRIEGTNEPNGVLEELASIPMSFKLTTPTTPEKIKLFFNAAQDIALSFGYTTVQEGRAQASHESLAIFAESGDLIVDVPAYIDYSLPEKMETSWYDKNYKDHYRIAGFKLTLDGSPQGRTAWRTEPYLVPPPGAGKDYKGYPAIPDDNKVQEIVDKAYEHDWQLLCHVNGDAAIDQFIKTVANAVDKYGSDDRRTTLIHGQYLRYDQIDSLAKYDIIPSLFPMHTFYWGDWHRELIGEEKGSHISPIKTALEKCGIVTSHTDAPIALPNLMMIMWTTVNRVTRSGDIIAPEEALTPYEALKSITKWGAYQHFEEDTKGSLKKGKLADMVVLSENPLKIDPMKLKDIVVLKTYKNGELVYTKNQ